MLQKVSVIIPTKDRVSYLNQAVDSVLNQTYPVHEILIVNDGSNKNCISQIDDLKKLGSNIAIFHFSESRGSSFARNFALNNAKGDFIIFLDDDDLIHPKMIESSLFLFKDDVDIVTSLFTYFFSEEMNSRQLITILGGTQEEQVAAKFVKPISHIDCRNLETRPFYEIMRNAFPIHSSIIRKRCLEKVRFPEDLKLGEDTYFWLKLAHQGCRFKCNKDIQAFYRLHDGNHIKHLADIRQSSLDYLFKLESSGMLQKREDIFFIHSQIFINLFRRKDANSIKYFILMQGSPDLFIKVLIYYIYKKFLGHDDIAHRQIMPYIGGED